MGAVWYRVRAELRARWRASVSLALLVGLFGGVVMGAAAAARRTGTAHERFRVAHRAHDIIVLTGAQAAGSAFAQLPLGEIARFPEVDDSIEGSFFFAFGRTTRTGSSIDKVAAVVSDGGEWGRRISRFKILEGREADQADPHEVTVSYAAARNNGITVGDTLEYRFLRWSDLARVGGAGDPSAVLAARDLGVDLGLRVTGIEAAPGELPPLPGNQFSLIHLTDAFARRYGPGLASGDMLVARLRGGASAVPSFQRSLDSLTEGVPAFTLASLESAGGFERSIESLSLAWWTVALMVGIASVLIVGQAVARQAQIESDDTPTVRALGSTPAQVAAVTTIRAAILGLVAAGAAVVLAAISSLATPLGIARIAEPAPGLRFDAAVFVIGAVAIVGVIVALTIAPAVRLSRARWADREGRVRPSVAAAALGRLGFPVTAVAGTRLALETGRGRSAVPVRSTLVAVTVALVGVGAAFTYGYSLQLLLETPRLYGWNVDFAAGTEFAAATPEEVGPTLRSHPGVETFSFGALSTVGIEGRRVDAFGFGFRRGAIEPVILAGHTPEAPTDRGDTREPEVMLGSLLAQSLGRGIGDTVEVQVGDRSLRMRVVAVGAMPDIAGSGPGAIAAMSFESLRRLAPDLSPSTVLVRFAAGTDGDALARDLRARLGLYDPLEPEPPIDFVAIQALPAVLAWLGWLLALATLAHTIHTAVRRRRRDLAILRVLGFVRAQARATVRWQSGVVTVLALGAGIPLGVVAGRWLWLAFSDALGTEPQPQIPGLPLGLASLATIAVAVMLSMVSGRAAGRVRPAVALRAE